MNDLRIAGVVCEYDPFHNGHKYMLTRLRNEGVECIIGCMSQSFTQRGEPALLPWKVRAESAVSNGMDLVIGLPVTYSCAGAERFAYGGVYLLEAAGICDTLSFGSECGDTELIKAAAGAVLSDSIKPELDRCLSQGMTFAAAREQAVRKVFGDEAALVLREPNNILGIEYCKALWRIGSDMEMFTLKRTGAAHDSTEAVGGIASASRLREMLRNGEDISGLVPDEGLDPVYGGVNRHERLEAMLLYRLKTMTRTELSELPDMSEGLENRLYKAICEGRTAEEILLLAKCRRYTLARLRRSLMHAFLHITKADTLIPPQYIRVLAFSEKGRSALRQMKKSASLPIVQRYADARRLSDEGRRLFDLETRCEGLYELINNR